MSDFRLHQWYCFHNIIFTASEAIPRFWLLKLPLKVVWWLIHKLRLARKQWIPTPYFLTSWYKSQLHLLLICWFLHEIVRNFALKIELPTASKTALLIFAWNSRKPYLSWEILIKNLKSIWYPKSDKNLMFDFEIMPYFRSGRCGGKEEHRKSALNMVFRESKSLSSTRTVDIPQRTTNSPKSFPG